MSEFDDASAQNIAETMGCAPVAARGGAHADAPVPACVEEDSQAAEERLRQAVLRVPRHREIFLRLLSFCETRRTLAQAEDEVGSYPEFSQAAQSPYHLIMTMVDEGGLRWMALDVQGGELTRERTEGLSEDEVDDLTDTFAVETTEVGKRVRAHLAPEARLRELFASVPQRLGAYLDVIDFCAVPRSYKEVDALLRAGDALRTGVSAQSQPLQPSFYLDMLERSGGLVWNEGWIATGKGSELAKTLRAVTA